MNETIVATKCCLIYSVNRLKSRFPHKLCSKTEVQNVSVNERFASHPKARAGKCVCVRISKVLRFKFRAMYTEVGTEAGTGRALGEHWVGILILSKYRA